MRPIARADLAPLRSFSRSPSDAAVAPNVDRVSLSGTRAFSPRRRPDRRRVPWHLVAWPSMWGAPGGEVPEPGHGSGPQGHHDRAEPGRPTDPPPRLDRETRPGGRQRQESRKGRRSRRFSGAPWWSRGGRTSLMSSYRTTADVRFTIAILCPGLCHVYN